MARRWSFGLPLGLKPNLKIIFHIVEIRRSVIVITTVRRLLFILPTKIVAVTRVTTVVTADVVVIIVMCPRRPRPTLILPTQVSMLIGKRPV